MIELLYSKYYSELLYCTSLSNNHAVAEDVVRSVFYVLCLTSMYSTSLMSSNAELGCTKRPKTSLSTMYADLQSSPNRRRNHSVRMIIPGWQ